MVVDGVVRATFAGDLDGASEQSAFQELLAELFGRLGHGSGRGTGDS